MHIDAIKAVLYKMNLLKNMMTSGITDEIKHEKITSTVTKMNREANWSKPTEDQKERRSQNFLFQKKKLILDITIQIFYIGGGETNERSLQGDLAFHFSLALFCHFIVEKRLLYMLFLLVKKDISEPYFA